ncbi:MAG: hypothetical protein A2W99_01020 [Bacteroidetes bacterium GWF2_33_16]|nr:MAG: hypothetical protein A2X00_03725 [Bacteroidetes bacterium GWE2_32_14]OFY08843.1 MAG: hypothetical protein A2W99_01020 [Bacteroidetes bacterium GWF2_33_16]
MIKHLLNSRNRFLIIFLILPLVGFSQKWKLSRTEILVGVGTVSFFGDIGGAESADALWISDLDILNTRPNINIGLRYRIDEWGTIRGNLTYGRFLGSDENSINAARNYSFTTNLYEFSGYFEYWILKEKQMVQYSSMTLRDGLRKFNKSLSLYVFIGIGAAYFAPVAGDSFIDSPRFVGDKNLGIVLPVGIGIKYPLSQRNFIGFEFTGRLTGTDYIDGFKPKGSEYNDSYYFTSLYITHKLKPKTKGSRVKF